MPNQYTKAKKEREAEAAKRAARAQQAAKEQLHREQLLGDEIHVIPVTMEQLLGGFNLSGKNKSSCDEHAENQPHLTLIAQDNLTPSVLRYWISLARQKGVSAEKIAGVESTLRDIEKWRTANPLTVKLPD